MSEYLSLHTSALVMANLHYIISKQRDKNYANECLAVLLKYIRILPLEFDAIEYGLTNKFEDFEDAIQYHVAKKNHCVKILSRNLKDYKHSSIPVMTAEHFFNH